MIFYKYYLRQNGVGSALMDPILFNSCSNQQFLRFVHINLLCVEEYPADRPTNSEFIFMITNESDILPTIENLHSQI